VRVVRGAVAILAALGLLTEPSAAAMPMVPASLPEVSTLARPAGSPATVSVGQPDHDFGTIRPRLWWRADGISAGLAGLASLAASRIVIDRLPVPSGGLDRSRIHWSVDRRSVRAMSDRTLRWSDRSVSVAAALPVVLYLARATRRTDLRGLATRFALYTEASLWNEACTSALKRSTSRPRPTLYQDPWVGPSRTAAWDFESMPSGHASRAWCGASFAVVDHLYSRPQAGTWEDVAVGFASGALAGVTAALRVRGGAHFTSDVLVGSGIGAVCGAAVPALHTYECRRSSPSAVSVARPGTSLPDHPSSVRPGLRRWLVALASLTVGASAGVGMAQL
jgi:membrane-associated phospholipid phosphatase